MPKNVHNISGPLAPKPKPKVNAPKDLRKMVSDVVKAQEIQETKDHVEISKGIADTQKIEPPPPEVTQEQIDGYVQALMEMEEIPNRPDLDEIIKKYDRGDFSQEEFHDFLHELSHDFLPPS